MRMGAFVLSLAGMLALSGFAAADTLDMPTSTDTTGPTRGLTMAKVEAKFGAPTERSAAVGTPPITRWEYPGFVVYFEHEYVIHSVTR
jgi:hypothetical protein